MDIRSEKLYALVSTAVSAGDGVQYKTVPGHLAASAFLDTMADFMAKSLNKITTASTTLASGGSAGAVAVGLGGDRTSGIQGTIHGIPFHLSAAGTMSASPTSLISTASNTIRKVLVTLGGLTVPPASSIGTASGSLGFVYGSAYATSAGAVTTGGQSAYFNLVPLPKASAGEIPLGWINVTNSFAVSAGLANHHLITDYRETQGVNLSLIMAGLIQP